LKLVLHFPCGTMLTQDPFGWSDWQNRPCLWHWLTHGNW
jgi:hypothetical protein